MRIEPFGILGTGVFFGRWNKNQLQKQLNQMRIFLTLDLIHSLLINLSIHSDPYTHPGWITSTQTKEIPRHFLKVMWNQIGADDIHECLSVCSQNMQSELNWGMFSAKLNLLTLLPAGVCVMWQWVGSWCAVVQVDCGPFMSHHCFLFYPFFFIGKSPRNGMRWTSWPRTIQPTKTMAWWR